MNTKIKLWILLIMLFLAGSFISCDYDSGNKTATNDFETIYDGYVEPNSLSPGAAKEKYYINLMVCVDTFENIYLNDLNVSIVQLRDQIKSKWNIIAANNFNAFLNLGLAHQKGTSYEYYTKVYEELISCKDVIREKYSIDLYNKPQ